MTDNNAQIVMDAPLIRKSLERVAREIAEHTTDAKKLVLVGIHTGGVFLAKRLQRILEEQFRLAIPVGALDINLYRDDWTRLHTQPVVRSTHLPFPIDEQEVVLVDDVLYTGRTIRAALDAIMDYGRPKRVQVAVLVDRGHRELPICGQFTGMMLSTETNEQVNVLLSEKNGVDRVIIER